MSRSRTETFDLSVPRNVAALEALLDDGADDEDERGKKTNKPKKNKRRGQSSKPDKPFFFKLRDAPANAAAGGAGEALERLQDMFRGSCDPGVVAEVLEACGSRFDAALDVLLNMGLHPPPSPALAAAHASRPASAAAAAAAGAPAHEPLAEGAWGVLPLDVRRAVLALLALADLARAASACREFAARAREARTGKRHLLVPAGLSYAATVGIIAAHSGAETIDLSKGRTLALDPASGQLQPGALEQAEAQLFAAVVAVAEAEAARERAAHAAAAATETPAAAAAAAARRGGGGGEAAVAPVRALVLRGLRAAGDRVLLEVLQSLKHLRRLDLSDCNRLTNRMLHRLAAYQAEPEGSWAAAAGDPGDTSDWEDGDGEERSWRQSAAPPGDEGDGDGGRGDGDAAAAPSAAAASPSQAPAVQVGVPNPAVRDPLASGVQAAMEARVTALTLEEVAPREAASAASASPRGLTAVRLACVPGVRDDGLRALLGSGATKASLTALDVSGCHAVTSAGLQLPPLGVLRSLRARLCHRLTSLALQLPGSHPLASLDLAGCRGLRELTLAVPALAELNLSGCGALYRLRLRCPALARVKLAHCGQLAEFFPDAWLVPRLEELSLFGCRRAHGAQLEAVLATCPALRTLDLNGCWAVRSLALTGNARLRVLDVSGCSGLTSLSLTSPALEGLSAQGCAALRRLVLRVRPLLPLSCLLLANCTVLSEVVVVEGAAAATPAPMAIEAEGEGRRRGGASRRRLDLAGCRGLSSDDAAALAQLVGSLG